MKKYIMLFVAVALILVGLIGGVIFSLPATSDEYDMVAELIDAVAEGDSEKVNSLTSKNFNGSNLDSSKVNKVAALAEFVLGDSDLLPEDVKSVDDFSLIGCSVIDSVSGDNAILENYDIGYYSVKAVVKIDYTTAEDEEFTITCDETFKVTYVGGKYVIS